MWCGCYIVMRGEWRRRRGEERGGMHTMERGEAACKKEEGIPGVSEDIKDRDIWFGVGSLRFLHFSS